MFQESARITEALEKMTLPFAESYFVHFRFQDFLRRHRKKHFIDLTGYYRQCLKQLPVDASLLIFSDEPEKIEQHYPEIGKAGTFVECNSDLVSLYAMARCRLGGICANSTFSWWGAYLNPSREKRVYMPDRFTNSRRCGPDFYPRNTLVCPVARPKAYVINLDRRQDRWARIQRQLKGLESTIDVCRFSAVEVAAHPHMGCTRSHKNIVSMAKENMWPMVMVMEDDAVLRNPRATRDLVDFLYTRQDWDVCFGGVSACRPELWAALTARTPSCPTVYKNISEQIMEIPVSLSSVMVIYNQTSYDTVLAIDQYDPNVRIDVFLSENIHRKWVHVPFLAHQQPGYSDIQHCELDSTSLYEPLANKFWSG